MDQVQHRQQEECSGARRPSRPVGCLVRQPLLLKLEAFLERLRQLNLRAEDYLDRLHQRLNQEDCLDLRQLLHNRNLGVFLGPLSLHNLLKLVDCLAQLQLQHNHRLEVYLDRHNLLKVVDCLEIQTQTLRNQLKREVSLDLHNLSRAEGCSAIPIPILHSQPRQVDYLARPTQHHNLSKVAACLEDLVVNRINLRVAYSVVQLLHNLLKAVCSAT